MVAGEFGEPVEAKQTVYVRIRGLRAVPGERDVFELDGAMPRSIDWEAALVALGNKPLDECSQEEMTERGVLQDKLARVVYLEDVMKLLASRIG